MAVIENALEEEKCTIEELREIGNSVFSKRISNHKKLIL